MIKKVGNVLLVLFFSACASQSMPQQTDNPEWKTIGQSAAADFAYDARHVDKLKSGYISVQFRLTYRADTDEGREASKHMTEMTTPAMEGKAVKPVAHGITTVEIDCAKRRFRMRQQKVLSADDELIEAVPGVPDPEWQSPPADNVYTSLIKEVCARR